MYDVPVSNEEYKKQEEAMNKKMKSMGGKSKALSGMAKKIKHKEDPNMKMNCRMADMIFRESMDMYREGELTFEEMTEDLYKSLKAIK